MSPGTATPLALHRRAARRLAFIGLLLAAPVAPAATQVDIAGPAGSVAFGTEVKVLSNGNIVVSDPQKGANVGAVYLYDPTGVLISTLSGSNPDDQVGSGGITVLASGNYVILSDNWHNGGVANAGAVTFGNAVTGVSGTVSAGNSLVGTQLDDDVGSSGIFPLGNGNYVVVSAGWDNGVAEDAGAVTWASGSTGKSGVITAANSLVGTTTGDRVGQGGVIKLGNGNFVVGSPRWNNGAVVEAGAVTWVAGATGTTGPVSPANSLVGTTDGDHVGGDVSGNFYVVALGNGNYVVPSRDWDNGLSFDAGAVTWGNGNSGTAGPVAPGNSLVGTSIEDRVGLGGVVALVGNGNYVVCSPNWNDVANVDAGAATWVNGNAAFAGVISPSNSLIGADDSDFVGNGGAYPLANGNYVVASYVWHGAGLLDGGAVTWGDGGAGTVGAVSTANSLTGTSEGDTVGVGGVTALVNGNYVVSSPYWANAGAAAAGAVTWANGSAPFPAVVSISNSLVGSSASDGVGAGGITALTNGNYVVLSLQWDDGSTPDAGAATWGNGATGVSGAVAAANSLIGSSEGDFGDSAAVTQLDNGNFVVNTPAWGPGGNVGAVTWVDGSAGITGAISAANALVGSDANDGVGNAVTALVNGNYVVVSRNWTDGVTPNLGAVTWADGGAGTSGVVSASNSLIGTTTFDFEFAAVTALDDGDYAVDNPGWDNGVLGNAGAVSLARGTEASAGAILADNSVRGTVANGGFGLTFDYDETRQQLAVGRPASNTLSLFSLPGNVVFANGFE